MDDDQDKQEKPFDTVSIVVLVMISLMSDGADLVAVMGMAIPVVGQILYFGNSMVISPIAWTILQGTILYKTGGFKASSLIALLGGVGNVANVPGSATSTTIWAILQANSPQLKKVADVASGKGIGKAGAAGGVGEDKELEARNERRREADEKREKKGEGMSPEERRKARLVHSEEDIIAPEAGKPSEVSTERKPESDIPSRTPSAPQGAPGQAGAAEEGGAPKKPEIEPEALGEKKELLGEKGALQEELFGEQRAGPGKGGNEDEELGKKQKRVVPFPKKNEPPRGDENLKETA